MSPSHQWYGILPGWVPFYALILVAVVLFARRADFLVRLMLIGKPAARWDHVPERLLSVMVTDLAADAGRIILAPAPSDHWQFAGRALAGVLAGLPHGAVEALFHLSWWFHAVLLLGFLVYLPYSK